MNDDYLWDGSGTPDPDVQRLERALGPLRSTAPPPRLPQPAARWRWPAFAPALATAALVLLMIGFAWRATHPRPSSWEVAMLAGQPRIGAATLTSNGRLAVGQTLTTDATSRARI